MRTCSLSKQRDVGFCINDIQHWCGDMAEIIVGVTGASGIILGHRTVDVLTALGHRVHLVLSRAALVTAQEETGSEFCHRRSFSTIRFLKENGLGFMP